MCGIFGVLLGKDATISGATIESTFSSLFMFSESRGKEAAGLAFRGKDSLYIYKEPIDAKKLIQSDTYQKIFRSLLKKEGYSKHLQNPLSFIGHSRLVTNGISELNSNNQPVVKENTVAIHNGIIVNADQLYSEFPQFSREFNVDTEILLDLFNLYREKTGSVVRSIQKTYAHIIGSASVAILFDDNPNILLASNTGSLYLCSSHNQKIALFASEKFILNQMKSKKYLRTILEDQPVTQVKAGTGLLFDLNEFGSQSFPLVENTIPSHIDPPCSHTTQIKTLPSLHFAASQSSPPPFLSQEVRSAMLQVWENLYNGTHQLRRCTKCILPETVPYITYDDEGVCNYCRNFEVRNSRLKGAQALKEFVSQYRSPNGEPDCIVGFSGGRDSTYGLHYVKNVLGMNPIAFTYDWGMVNDLARRNQSRVLAKLGVEHILVSADIKAKREHIRKNLEAWLKNPDLGMIPLLMAGDKQFYYYFHKIREQTGVKLFIFCGGHEIEETPFKYGFCGIDHGVENVMNCLTGISPLNKAKLINYYAVQYLKNPGYINRSIFDTLFAYYSTYLLPDDYLYLYHYIEWDEKTIIDTIVKEYDWEMAPDTNATWRIDDGTAPFYNYIYLTMAGFTEFDNFRSFQIREGKLTREKALEMIKEENKPRFEAIDWYGQTIGLDMNHAVKVINNAPRLYSSQRFSSDTSKIDLVQ